MLAKSICVAGLAPNRNDFLSHHKSSMHIPRLLAGIHQPCDEPCAILCLEQNGIFLDGPGPKSGAGTLADKVAIAQPIGYLVDNQVNHVCGLVHPV